MVESLYARLGRTWQKPSEEKQELDWARKLGWRRAPPFVRVERPLRIDRARALGYRAKPGFLVVRVRVRRGSLRKRRFNHGRKPRSMGGNKITAAKASPRIGGGRGGEHYPHCEGPAP